jgi:hypothetical protein
MTKYKIHFEKALKDAFNPENELKYCEFFSQFDNCYVKYSDTEIQILDAQEKILFESMIKPRGSENNNLKSIMSLLGLEDKDGDSNEYVITLKDGHKIVFGLPLKWVIEMNLHDTLSIAFHSLDINGFVVIYKGKLV